MRNWELNVKHWIGTNESYFPNQITLFPEGLQNDQGLVNVPFWEYWTSPYSSHLVDHIPHGWVMFNGDMTNDP